LLDLLVQAAQQRFTPCRVLVHVQAFVRQFAAVEPDWFATLDLPSVRSWLNGWLVDPLFIACMVKLPAEGLNRQPALTSGSPPSQNTAGR
jgi:hypothetical protein